MHRRRAIAAALLTATIAATSLAATSGPVGAAPDDDGEKSSALAEAQFLLYLLTETDLAPSDATCTRPPIHDLDGTLLCFALVNGRDTVAAVATLDSPGVYRFTAISKVDSVGTPDQMAPVPEPSAPAQPAPAPEPAPTPDAGSAAAADAATLAAIDAAVGDLAGLTDYLVGHDASITAVTDLSFDAPTGTISVAITSTATDEATRNDLAFFVVDTIAYLWEADQPLRDPATTIRARLEVTVDGVLYGTPYDAMVGVADYTIDFQQWLAIVLGGGALRDPAASTMTRRLDAKPSPSRLMA